jgi:hypothetical protein
MTQDQFKETEFFWRETEHLGRETEQKQSILKGTKSICGREAELFEEKLRAFWGTEPAIGGEI